VLQFTNALHLDCEDRLSLVYSPSVIGAIRDIYGALLNGASVHLLPPRELKAPGLIREIRGRGITVLHAVPALFRRVIEALAPHERLESVRVVYLASDRIGWSDVDAFRRSFSPSALLYVTLGLTECTTVHSHWFVDESVRTTSAQLPVGRAVPDRTVIIADEDGKAVADGEIGELIVTSRFIGLGYWGAPELTKQAFGADGADPEARVFRTGDLGRRRPDGLIEFVGRKDEQFKLRGHRIEPAEVESALISCPEVADAVVVVRQNEAGVPRSLAAYVVLRPDARGMLPRHLAAMLQRRLPRYMVPWPIIAVEELPRLSNFKIDRVQLALMDTRRTGDPSRRVTTEMVDEVAKVFERVLGVEGAMPDDGVSSLGGDSLQAITIAAELEERFSVVITDDVMDTARTIQDLAWWIASQRVGDEPPRPHDR
jgi:acyl-coenzyme A synthetase/AMP-(fatty) acid ligase